MISLTTEQWIWFYYGFKFGTTVGGLMVLLFLGISAYVLHRRGRLKL